MPKATSEPTNSSSKTSGPAEQAPGASVTYSLEQVQEMLSWITSQTTSGGQTQTSSQAAQEPTSAPAVLAQDVVGSSASSAGSSSSAPVFTKTHIQKQFEFNTNLLHLLTPVLEFLPADVGIRNNVTSAINQITQRNELLAIADKDPTVWEYFEEHSKAQKFQVSNPILASFLKDRKKVEKKEPAKKGASFRPHPYAGLFRPFRAGGAAWTPAPPASSVPYFNNRGSLDRRSQDSTFVQQGNVNKLPPMCFNCGGFGHLASNCFFRKRKDNSVSAYQNAEFLDSEINKLIDTQAIQEVFDASKIRINPLSVAIEVKRNWKAVMAEVAEKQSVQAALSFRWKLSILEKKLRAKVPVGLMPSPRNRQYGGVQSVAGGYHLLSLSPKRWHGPESTRVKGSWASPCGRLTSFSLC
ncbi:hypothetical protein GCK32_017298 [Trichostrongylus colubriformis]|uniref:CCHC-type domain-containing protein n=1 Tax=Trichostrongylus colubriformis TaxID=6319 RepID=A0AAN8F9B9_TRICO